MNWNEQDRIRRASFEQKQRQLASTLSYADLFFWRLALINPAREELSGVEAVIRGHHLMFYKRLLGGESPYSIAESSLSNKEGGLLNDDVYAPDILGVSPLDQFITQTMMQSTYERYKRLPPDSKVSVVTTYDQICNSCTIGEHCRVMDPEGRIEDGVYIWQAFKEIEKQGNADKSILRVTLAELPGYRSIERSAILNLVTTKKVLDQAISAGKDLNFWKEWDKWQVSIDEMISDPNVSIDTRRLKWSYRSRNFISKRIKLKR